VDFHFESKYDPKVGHIALSGDVIYVNTEQKITEIEKMWKKDKKLPTEVVEGIMGNILSKCNIEALIMSKEVNLPPPLPMPKVKSK